MGSQSNYEVLEARSPATEKVTPIKLWTRSLEVEAEARRQLLNIAQLPFIFRHVAVMPDVHAGKGATVGSVIPTRGAIIPAAVGVDIGCGMMAVRLPIAASQLPDNLVGIRTAIEKAVPHGRTDNGGKNDRGAYHIIPDAWPLAFDRRLRSTWETIARKHPKVHHPSVLNHLGTLGTGNHFIEVCLDDGRCVCTTTPDSVVFGVPGVPDQGCTSCGGAGKTKPGVWVMLHSGSRGVGNKIGNYFIELAKEDMRQFFINLPDRDLAYLPEGTQHFQDYVEAVSWAQDYAALNRELMMQRVLEAIHGELKLPPTLLSVYENFQDGNRAVACHHNYIARENHFGENVWVTRKGAVRARKGDLGIIPGSMGTRSYIVRGLGQPESFMSCSHGAGRRMSRTEARRRFTVLDHVEATKGVECRKDLDVIDETPAAYKPIDAVMAAQQDLVEVVHELRQVLCVKG